MFQALSFLTYSCLARMISRRRECSRTLILGMKEAVLCSGWRYSSLFIMWHPNFVLTMDEVCPFWSANAAVSNSLTIFPLVKVPRSPPCFPDGQSETSLAMFENFSPLLRRSCIVFASCSVFTRMCAQWTLSGMLCSCLLGVYNHFQRHERECWCHQQLFYDVPNMWLTVYCRSRYVSCLSAWTMWVSL
jgi:hypothetical protein